MAEDYPSYLKLQRSGELEACARKARTYLSPCRVCPRGCLVDRLADEKGKCNVGRDALLASYGPHFGEEAVLRGMHGSGTVFFAGCNLQCVYCQNYDISHMHRGRPVSAEELARVFLEIQVAGCHNLNLVTPTHVVPQILEALVLAVEDGFRLPLVYNTSGYDSLIMLHLLDGVVDVYMPDFKYADDDLGLKYSGIPAYNRVARRAIKEMHRQVGVLALDERGVARRGVLIRHLVLPDNLAGTKEVMEFIATELSPDSYVNVMGQYRPEYRAFQYPQVARYPTGEELAQAVRWALDAGIHRGIPFGP
jgi:putative pyruvate formate lyase activating enzyme